MLSSILIICWIILLYTWIGYPLLLVLLTSVRIRYHLFPLGHAWKKADAEKNDDFEFKSEEAPRPGADFPSISVIVAAHNEEKCISGRIENLLEIDFPPKKLTIRIGVDGSEDRTAEIAMHWMERSSNVKTFVFPERRGKVAVLKDLVAISKEEILVFTDANTVFKKDAMTQLMRHFKDQRIGGVCGKLSFRGDEKEGLYWQWETKLKAMESDLDSCLGANGAIYAIRRNLFWLGIPNNAIVDDFVIGMKVREQGFRMVYEPRALAEEDYPTADQEWVRRVRIGSGDYQALGLCRRCLSPNHGVFAWMFWSHKVLRWFTPHLLIAMVILAVVSSAIAISLGTANSPVSGQSFCITLVLPLLIFLSATVARFLRRFLSINMKRKIFKPLDLCDYFLSMQMALFFGFLRFCRGNLRGHWNRTSRD